MDRFDTFLSLLGSLNQAALDDAHWPATSALIDDTFGSRGNGLVVGEGFGDDVRIHFARYLSRGQRRQDLEREYLEVYHPQDEALPRLRALPDGQLAHLSDLYTEDEKKTSLVYNEGLPRLGGQNCLYVRFAAASGLRSVWSLASPVGSGGWPSAQVELIEHLLPHVRQYVRIRHALAGAEALGAGLTGLLDSTGIGVLHLDRRGRIAEANDPARDLLLRDSGLWEEGGFLRAWLPADNARLQRLVSAALPRLSGQAAGGSMLVRHPFLVQGLTLHVHPATARQRSFGAPELGALVLVAGRLDRPQRLDAGLVASVLGLTPAESRVAIGVAEGRTAPDIAALSGRAASSVRAHLKRIHRKLGVSRRADLVRLVLSVPERAGLEPSPSPPQELQKHGTPES